MHSFPAGALQACLDVPASAPTLTLSIPQAPQPASAPPLPPQPPLAPLISAWEGLNICIAAVVDEQHFGSIDGWSASGGGLQVAASVGARGQAAARERRSTLAPVPGHVAATPAPPLEGLEAGGERQGGEAVDVVEAQQAQHDLVSHSATQQEAWEAARLALAGGTRAKGGLCDSPSEMHTPRDCPPWQGAEQAQQGTQGGGGGGGGGDGDPLQPASRSTSRSASGSSSNGTRGVLDDAAEAALREAAADFMHPARWAAARAAPAHPDQAGAAAHSFSTRSLSGGSWHSFLVPGAQLSSEASSQVDGAEGPPPGVAALPQGTAAAEQPAVGGEGELLQPAGWTAHAAADDQPLSVADRLALALRAAHLLALFAPFLLLGTLLLLVAARLAEGSPAAGRLRTRAFKLLLWACSQSGAAFIKWAQWSATRTDIFPGVRAVVVVLDRLSLQRGGVGEGGVGARLPLWVGWVFAVGSLACVPATTPHAACGAPHRCAGLLPRDVFAARPGAGAQRGRGEAEDKD